MSKYTTEVRFICEMNANYTESKGFESIDSILDKSASKIFNFDFPIFDENYRLPLEKKILRHYYTREICEETVGLWKLRLQTRLCEIMPYYNQLYKSELLDFNPLYDTNLNTKYTKNGEGTTTDNGSNERKDTTTQEVTSEATNDGKTNSKTTTSSTNYDAYSDTPQGALTNVENNTYLTNARKKTDSGNSTNESTSNDSYNGKQNASGTVESKGSNKNKRDVTNTETYIQSVTGKSGGVSYSKRLQEFRETFLNIDMLIISELSDLFFGLWE